MTSQSIKKKFSFIYFFSMAFYIGITSLMYLNFSMDLDKTQAFSKRSSHGYDEQTLLNKLSLQMGYGAFIHHYKNYLLRRDEFYFNEAVKNHHEIQKTLLELEANHSDSQEYVEKIKVIEDTINQYYDHLLSIKDKYNSEEIKKVDKIVQMNDIPAIAAIKWIEQKVYDTREVLKKDFKDHVNHMGFMLKLITLGAIFFFISFFTFAFYRIRILQKRSDEERQNRIHLSRIGEIQEMTGTIAHEINNPLAIILGAASSLRLNLKRDRFDKERAMAKTKLIEETVSRISMIVQSMKNLSHKSDSKTWDSFYLSETLNDVINLSNDRFKHNGIKLDIHGDDSIPLYGQRNQIGQVLLNLLNNSSDVLKDHHEKWVRVEIISHLDNVEIHVIDSGPALSDEVINKLMTPFFTTKPIGKGTGIGLSISKTILEDHKGKLEFVKGSKYTTFKITLPIHHECLAEIA